MPIEGFHPHVIEETEARLNTHEAVCAHRYDQIMEKFETGEKRMQKLEYILYAAIAATLFGNGSLLELLKRLIIGE